MNEIVPAVDHAGQPVGRRGEDQTRGPTRQTLTREPKGEQPHQRPGQQEGRRKQHVVGALRPRDLDQKVVGQKDSEIQIGELEIDPDRLDGSAVTMIADSTELADGKVFDVARRARAFGERGAWIFREDLPDKKPEGPRKTPLL